MYLLCTRRRGTIYIVFPAFKPQPPLGLSFPADIGRDGFRIAPLPTLRSQTKQTETLRLSPPRSPAPKPDRPTDRPKRWANSRTTETRSHEERTSRNTYIFCTVRISSGRRQQPAGLRIDQKSNPKNDQNYLDSRAHHAHTSSRLMEKIYDNSSSNINKI